MQFSTTYTHNTFTDVQPEDLAELGWQDNISSFTQTSSPSLHSRKPIQTTTEQYWRARDKPLTLVQIISRHTLIQWFQHVVPAMNHLHRYRSAAVYLSKTRRRVVCHRQLQHTKRAIRVIQAFFRMSLVKQNYRQTQHATVVLQRFYRRHYSNGLLMRLHMLIRHRNLLMKHTALSRELHTAKRDLACCNRELANIRNSRDWTMCPITREAIDEPVVNCVDGKLYEKNALEEWLKRDSTSPLTRAPMHRNDVWSLQDIRALYRYMSFFNTCFENNSQYVELALRQCTSLKCRECNKEFHAQSYISHKQLFRSFVQHHKAAHT